jgi:hypothetical protein
MVPHGTLCQECRDALQRTVVPMAAFLLITGSCAPRVQSPAAGPSITTDGDRLAVHGGEIWYRVVGGGPGLPVLLLHGGPGVSSYHMKPLDAGRARAGDQKEGCHRDDRTLQGIWESRHS